MICATNVKGIHLFKTLRTLYIAPCKDLYMYTYRRSKLSPGDRQQFSTLLVLVYSLGIQYMLGHEPR